MDTKLLTDEQVDKVALACEWRLIDGLWLATAYSDGWDIPDSYLESERELELEGHKKLKFEEHKKVFLYCLSELVRRGRIDLGIYRKGSLPPASYDEYLTKLADVFPKNEEGIDMGGLGDWFDTKECPIVIGWLAKYRGVKEIPEGRQMNTKPITDEDLDKVALKCEGACIRRLWLVTAYSDGWAMPNHYLESRLEIEGRKKLKFEGHKKVFLYCLSELVRKRRIRLAKNMWGKLPPASYDEYLTKLAEVFPKKEEDIYMIKSIWFYEEECPVSIIWIWKDEAGKEVPEGGQMNTKLLTDEHFEEVLFKSGGHSLATIWFYTEDSSPGWVEPNSKLEFEAHKKVFLYCLSELVRRRHIKLAKNSTRELLPASSYGEYITKLANALPKNQEDINMRWADLWFYDDECPISIVWVWKNEVGKEVLEWT